MERFLSISIQYTTMSIKRRKRRYRVRFKQRPLKIDYKLLNKIKESLTFDEVNRVLNACETLEERALIELAVNTGIRRNDIVDIEIDRIDIERRRIAFWEEKKDRYWMVAISPEVTQTIKMFIQTLPILSRQQRGALPLTAVSPDQSNRSPE